MNQMAPGGNSEFDRLIATISEAAGSTDWLEVANSVAIIRDKELWRGRYRSESEWLNAAAHQRGITTNTLRRYLSAAQFLKAHVKSITDRGGRVVVVGPSGRESKPVMATVELIKRMHDVSPSFALKALNSHLDSDLSYRAVKRQYDELFAGTVLEGINTRGFDVVLTNPPYFAKAIDPAKISSRRAHQERNELGALIESHINILSGIDIQAAEISKLRFKYVAPDVVVIGNRATPDPFVDGYDFKRLSLGSSKAAVAKLVSEAAFSASFFRRYWLILDASEIDAHQVVESVTDLELSNIGVARCRPDEQDNLDLLCAPTGEPTPNRHERSVKQAVGQ